MNRVPRIIFPLLLIIGLTTVIAGQASPIITLNDIYKARKFSSRTLNGLNSMNDGLHYTVQNRNKIDKYSYRTGEISETLFDASEFDEISQFSGYSFNATEDKILLETGQERIYRHSYLAAYYVYDMSTGELKPMWEPRLMCRLWIPGASSVKPALKSAHPEP